MKEKILTVSNVPLYQIDLMYIAIISTDNVNVANVGIDIESFRQMFPEVKIQGVNPKCIFGTGHIFRVVQIILESNNRKIKIAKRLEMELLLRLICSNQIEKAIHIGGIKNNGPCCFILLSENRRDIGSSIKYLKKMFVKQNMSSLDVTREKMVYISNMMEISLRNYTKREFLKILTEKAALVSL